MKKPFAKLLCLALVLAMTLGLAVTASAAIPGYDTDGENDYYANMYRYYNSDGTLKSERNSVEYINSVYGEWAARNQAVQSLGAADDMMNELLVKYWESYGMKKELFHEGEEDEAVYAVYTPMYQPEGKEFPLLVVCHGGGSNIYAAEQFGFIEEAAKRGYIALFISWGNNPYKEAAQAEGITSEAYTFKRAYDEVIENYPVDTTRVYVAGFSGGGNAAAYIGGTYPDLVTAIMSSTGAGLQGSAQSIDEDAGTSSLAKAKEYGLPLFMGYGLLDNENRWPVSDQLSEMGPHTDTTVEERLAFLNEWVEASGAQMEPMTMEELAEINALEDHNANARARFGLNFNEDYTKELYGYTYIFGDGLNADGDVVLRFMGVPLAGHQLTYGWAEQYLDFAENFYRDAETGKIVVAAPDDTPYYANMYRYYNEDGTLKSERQTTEFANSVYGAWAARNQYLQSQGSADDMMTEFNVRYWETYGMEKTLWHESEEDEAVYAVYAPMYMEDGAEYPLLVVCHGGGQNIYAAEQFGFIEEAAERGYIAVFISWGNNPYKEAAKAEGITSEAYTFKKAYDEVIENYPVDTTRVYVAGFSGGGNAAAYIGGTYPELVTAIMSSTGAGLQGSAQSIDEDAGTSSLAKAKEYGLPLFMGYGMLDNENRWPVSDQLSEMGPHTDTTVEERLAFLNEWVEASGAQMEPVTMEQLEAFNAIEDKNSSASARFGLNFNEEYTKTIYFGRDYVNEDVGYDYLFGDGLNENGDVVLRFMAVPMAGHQLTYGWAHEYLDFAENFSRDPSTGKIVVGGAERTVSGQKLTVDGAAADAEMYNIDGYNYFKLRDVAMLLSGTDAQFGVSYDEEKATVTVTPGMAYEPVGGELETGADNSASCVESRWTLLADGAEQTFTVYNIGGYNFFKLRDLGKALGFGVSFDEASGTAAITTEQDAIKSVTALGSVEADGAKVYAIAIEYASEIGAAGLSLDDYAIEDYSAAVELGSDPGKPTKIYVNDAPATAETGKDSGNYVIIEVNTDYQLASTPTYQNSMSIAVTQVAEVSGIAPTGVTVRNYTVTQSTGRNGRIQYNKTPAEGTYTLENIEGFELHSVALGNPFHATHCYSEFTGEYTDVDLAYSIYVPEGYSNDGDYALVVQMHDGGATGVDPMISLTKGLGPANFASEEMQDYLKAQGLDGAIVLVPQFSGRAAGDNYAMAETVFAIYQLIDATIEQYPAINMNRIYGSGQSMGSMMLLAMATYRDNFFAALWEHGSLWGNNYDMDNVLYQGTQYHLIPDAYAAEAGLNENWKNYYYMISDDNILCTDCTGDSLGYGSWMELRALYSDIGGVTIPKVFMDPLGDTLEEQSAKLEKLFAMDNATGIYWQAFEGGNHMSTWIYSHKLDAAYYWLLRQTKESEDARGKVEAFNDEWAAETDAAKVAAMQTEDRIAGYYEDGTPGYLAVPAAGAGTIGYNSGLYQNNGPMLAAPGWTSEKGTIAADDAIVGVTAIGFVDRDGAKVKAIAVEYTVDLTGADVDLGTYEIGDFGITKGADGCDYGEDPGAAVTVYVNDAAAVSTEGGSGSGNYVIIEVNTDYLVKGNITNYNQTMNVDVLQSGTIRAENVTVTPATEKVANYTESEATRPNGTTYLANIVNPDGWIFADEISAYERFTRTDGTAFHAEDCFSQLYGDYKDYDLPYSLYVPENYDSDAADQSYGLALIIHPGSNNGTDPMLSLTGSRAATILARADMQQIVIDQGLDGLIVVVPQIETQDAHDNWSFDYSLEAVWQLVDYLTEEYPVDMDHIYATGMSMGGIYAVAMAAQRDNYFAGVWANGAQFGNNYNLADLEYDGLERFYDYEAETDPLIWTEDDDGNRCDYRNWYYLISDDNFLITNMTGDTFSSHMWQELAFLYGDLAGVTIPNVTWDPLTESDKADDYVKALVETESDMGFYWTTMTGGSHPQTWKYSNFAEEHYKWLLTQSREEEHVREKLDLDKPFKLAETQIQTEERFIMQDSEGNDVYYVTGAFGSGTADYNSTIYAMGGNGIIVPPNWKPEAK